MSKRFLVYGGTGAQGGAVVKALLNHGARVRMLVRDLAKNSFAGDQRVEPVVGEFGDQASLVRASRAVDGVYLVMPLVYDRPKVVQWGKNAIDAAVEAGAPLIVFNTSSVVAERMTGVSAIDIKVELEAYLKAAHIPSVVLRTTLYFGNLAAPWSAPAIVHQGVLAYPLPAEHKVSWLSWEDAAAFAVQALMRPEIAALKPTYQTGGAQALTGTELAATLSNVLGRPVAYVPVALDQFEAGLNASFGAPVGTEIAHFYRWLTNASQRDVLNVDPRPVLAALPIHLTSFDAWARAIPWQTLAGEATE